LLRELKNSGINLYLATNKRIFPTEKIIKYLGWDCLFLEIYALDKFSHSHFISKSQMLGGLIKNESLDVKASIYVGDRLEDFLAAAENGLSTILVEWGYGDFKTKEYLDGVEYVSSVEDILKMVIN
jgi:phosphoglycolate phosphatase